MRRSVERWPVVGNVKHGNASVIPSRFRYVLPRYRYMVCTRRTRHMGFIPYMVVKVYMDHIKRKNCKNHMVGTVCNCCMVC